MANASYRQLTNFFDRLSVVLQAGIDIRSAIRSYRDSSTGAMRVVCGRIVDEIDQGETFAKAMGNRGDFFPGMVVAMVDAGEQGGRLPAAARRISDYYKTLIEVRTQFLGSIAWPVIQLGLSILIIGLLILVLGWLVGDKVDPFGFGLSTAAYFTVYLIFVGSGAFAIVASYVALRYGVLGSLPLDIARKIPVLGRTIEMLTLSRCCWSMATAIEAGVGATETLQLGLKSTQQWYYSRFSSEIEKGVREGGNFGTVLRKVGVFPEDFLQAVEVGETTGKIPESLEQLATLYDHDSKKNLKLLGTVASTLVMVMIFVSIGFVVIQMYRSIIIAPVQDILDTM